MHIPSLANHSASLGATRPMVKGLFLSTCLLSIVSWYTTQQGMALYLSVWFSVLASIGVQAALVLVAWLIGFTKQKRALLIAVYAITATVSIAFSYASLYTWFEARERPALVQRKLYDTLTATAAKAETSLVAAVNEQQKHVLALEEMAAAEKTHGHISRAQDSDPYLARIREAVAREGQSYASGYREGAGEGVRYTAFDRHAKLARQSLEQYQLAQRNLTQVRAQLKPLDATDKQIREFRQAYDAIPWTAMEETLHAGKLERPEAPSYADFVDHTVTGQEDLLLAFRELLTAPTSTHVFAFALAAFIDLVVFLLAYASGPFFFASEERRWLSACASLDSLDDQVFVRGFLRKLTPGPRGIIQAQAATLTPGEQQFCLLLLGKKLAVAVGEGADTHYLIDHKVHEEMLESIASPGLSMKAMAADAR